MSDVVRCSVEKEGQIWRAVLDRPKANIVDREMMAGIRGVLERIRGERGPAKLLVFEGEGKHFSFGASVEEHRPGEVEKMLPDFHKLFAEIEALELPTAAIVRGQCLGGGFELAGWCGMVFAEHGAQLGCPEIKLGVFPPVGTLVMRWRAGGSRATRLLCTGESVAAETAERLGLVDACSEDPAGELERWFDEHLAPKSALSLRFAWRAARRPMQAALQHELPALERAYLEELMACADPKEGIQSFVEKRRPTWSHK